MTSDDEQPLQPIGPPVDATPAERPPREAITGRLVTVTPLDPALHGPSLFEALGRPENEDLWYYLQSGPFRERSAFETYLAGLARSIDPLFFAILDHRSATALGIASYMRIEPVHRVIEVGSIVFAKRLQRTPSATEAMFLMARRVFDELRYRRYEWKCNALNVRSCRAAERLGFTFEGVFRSHMISKGRSRDTAWFSMLASEWPARKAAFERWLDASNFTEDGRQRRSLTECRG